MRTTWRLALTTIALATAYYLLGAFVFGRLPWVSIPSWWSVAWPSKHAAVIAWFDALNIIGSFAAAFPIAVVVTVFVRQYKYWVSLIAAGGIATFGIVSSYVDYPPVVSGTGAVDWWLDSSIQFVALCTAPALLVWLCHRLPPNYRWSGP